MQKPNTPAKTPRDPLASGALEPARLYVLLELQNQLHLSKSATTELEAQIGQFTPEQVWRWLNALGSALRLNAVATFLASDAYTWQLEDLPLGRLRLTGVNPQVDRIIIDRAECSPANLREIWAQDAAVRQAFITEGVRPTLKPGYPPIFVREPLPPKGEGAPALSIFDGMHRVLSAVIADVPVIKAWVGRVTNPQGQPFIGPEVPYALLKLFSDDDLRDPARAKALQIVMELMAERFSNGRTALAERLSHQPGRTELQDLLRPIIDA